MKPAYPRSFSHIGITVPDIHKAFQFYSEAMGWYTIMAPSKVKKEQLTLAEDLIESLNETYDLTER